LLNGFVSYVVTIVNFSTFEVLSNLISTVDPIETDEVEDCLVKTSEFSNKSSSSLILSSIIPCFSLAESNSAFSDKSPCALASLIS
jgi:hypothetical protein